jgi:hypothetical protein
MLSGKIFFFRFVYILGKFRKIFYIVCLDVKQNKKKKLTGIHQNHRNPPPPHPTTKPK